MAMSCRGQRLSLTLSTVTSCVAFGADARVLSAATAIHTPDVTGLNCQERETDTGGKPNCKQHTWTHILFEATDGKTHNTPKENLAIL